MANSTDEISFCPYYEILKDVTPVVYYTNLITCVLNFMLSLCAIIGNSLIITAFCLNKELQTVSNILLMSLCGCDLMVGLIVHPMFIASHIDVMTDSYCLSVDVLHYSGIAISLSGASFLTLANISVERYFAVCFPFKYVMYCTKMKMIIAMVALWIIGILTGMTRFMGLPVETTGNLVTVLMVLTIIVILHSYVNIFRIAHRHKKQIFAQQQNFTGGSTHVREMKTSITMCIILCTFFISYLPTLVIYLISNGTNEQTFNFYLFHVFPWSDTMAFISSSLNPAIYCIRNREIRRAVLSLMKACRPRVRTPLHWQHNTAVTDLRTELEATGY